MWFPSAILVHASSYICIISYNRAKKTAYKHRNRKYNIAVRRYHKHRALNSSKSLSLAPLLPLFRFPWWKKVPAADSQSRSSLPALRIVLTLLTSGGLRARASCIYCFCGGYCTTSKPWIHLWPGYNHLCNVAFGFPDRMYVWPSFFWSPVFAHVPGGFSFLFSPITVCPTFFKTWVPLQWAFCFTDGHPHSLCM